MTNRDLKRRVSRFRRLHRLNAINYGALCAAAERQGYTVIEFNHLANDENVTALLTALQLGELAAKTKGFTYADQHQRLIFVHDGLGDGEKTLVLAHELGHIACEHFQAAPIIGKDVQEEYEANEFAHYLLHPSAWNKTYRWCRRHKIMAASFAALLVVAASLVLAATVVMHAKPDHTFYVTENGNKYHQEACMTLKARTGMRELTQEELENGAYEPCQVCLPE